ncbi:MAG: hypothetical protein ACKVN9_04435 [Methylophilaceae bacterium]
MKATVSHSQDPDLKKAPQALLRAAENARRLAEQTNTPFIVRSQSNPASRAVKTR